jgi:hypothetical protein
MFSKSPAAAITESIAVVSHIHINELIEHN